MALPHSYNKEGQLVLPNETRLVVEQLIKDGRTYTYISLEIGCNYDKLRNWLRRNNLKRQQELRFCRTCGKEFLTYKRFYCDDCWEDRESTKNQTYFTIKLLRSQFYKLCSESPDEAQKMYDEMVEAEGEDFTKFALGGDFEELIGRIEPPLDTPKMGD